MAGITTIEEANEFLYLYIKEFNQQFSQPINNTKNAFEEQPSKEKINTTLAVIDYRVIDAGYSIKYKKEYYSIHNEIGEQVNFRKGTKAMVIRCFDDSIYVNIKDTLYVIKQIPIHYEYSKELDYVEEKPKIKKTAYIPPMSHPWKKASYDAFIARQPHRASNQQTD